MLHCTSIIMNSKIVPQIFKFLFQTGYVNIFVLRGVFFSRYVQLISYFFDEKNISGEIWDILVCRSYRKLTWQSIKRKLHHWQKLELCKIIHGTKPHWKRYRVWASNCRKCVTFLVSLSSRCGYAVSLWKIFLFYVDVNQLP